MCALLVSEGCLRLGLVVGVLTLLSRESRFFLGPDARGGGPG